MRWFIPWLGACYLVAGAAALAQQPDPAFLQAALAALQSQRNQAMDALAAEQAKAKLLQDQIDKLRVQAANPPKADKPEEKKD